MQKEESSVTQYNDTIEQTLGCMDSIFSFLFLFGLSHEDELARNMSLKYEIHGRSVNVSSESGSSTVSMLCPKCGRRIDSAILCPNCGRLENVSDSAKVEFAKTRNHTLRNIAIVLLILILFALLVLLLGRPPQ